MIGVWQAHYRLSGTGFRCTGSTMGCPALLETRGDKGKYGRKEKNGIAAGGRYCWLTSKMRRQIADIPHSGGVPTDPPNQRASFQGMLAYQSANLVLGKLTASLPGFPDEPCALMCAPSLGQNVGEAGRPDVNSLKAAVLGQLFSRLSACHSRTITATSQVLKDEICAPAVASQRLS